MVSMAIMAKMAIIAKMAKIIGHAFAMIGLTQRARLSLAQKE